MTDQLTLLYGSDIDQQFRDFHAANPHVYERLRDLALQAKRKGRTRIGIGMLFEVLRWHVWMETDDPHSDFKLNHNYRSRYARLLMEEEPELDGMFETRSLRS